MCNLNLLTILDFQHNSWYPDSLVVVSSVAFAADLTLANERGS